MWELIVLVPDQCLSLYFSMSLLPLDKNNLKNGYRNVSTQLFELYPAYIEIVPNGNAYIMMTILSTNCFSNASYQFAIKIRRKI